MTLRLWMNTRILRPWLGLVWVREVDDVTGDQVRQYVKRHRAEERQEKAKRLHESQSVQVEELEGRRRRKRSRGLGSKARERVLWVAELMRDIMKMGGAAA